MNDTIVKTISISATHDRVWQLVTVPGWWITGEDGDRKGQSTRTLAGGTLVTDPRHGEFWIGEESVDPQRQVTFRWLFGSPEAENARSARSTIVRFDLEDQGEQVVVTVTETGFASIEGSEADREQAYTDNVGGWNSQMSLLKKEAEIDG